MSRAIDPFDELAAMFLTAPQAKAPGEATNGAARRGRPVALGDATTNHKRRPAHEPEVELLIVGHLPVRAGLWLTPYADAVGREHGATALIRLDNEEPTLHLLRADSQAGRFDDRPIMRQTLLDLAGEVDQWIVRAPSGSGPAQCASLNVDRITILTSGDEAAIYSVYQLIKGMVAGEQSTEDGDEDASAPAVSLPSIGLAVVGVDLATAKGVVDRVNRTTVSFLGIEVRLAMCLQRMDPGIKSTRHVAFADENCPSLPDVLMWLDEVKSLAATMVAPVSIAGKLHADRTEPAPTDTSPHSSDDLAAALNDEDSFPSQPDAQPRIAPVGFRSTPMEVRPAHRPMISIPQQKNSPPATAVPLRGLAGLPRVAIPASRVEVAQTLHKNVAPIKLAPKPAAHVEPKSTPVAREPAVEGQSVALSSYVDGLVSLPVRPPGHERVELAVDATGRLHLLGREQTLREMRLVESWVRAHREIIAMACPQHPIDQAARTVVHIFSAEPVSLADLHGADLRLHVLAPVSVNGQTAWFAAPLNA